MDPEDRDLLSEALADTKVETTETPAEAPIETVVETERPRDEQGRFVKAEEPKEAPKVEAKTEPVVPAAQQPQMAAEPPKSQDHRVPLRELLDEREKRQRYEQEVSQMRQQVEYLSRLAGQQPKPQEQQPPPDIFQNPDAYFDHRINPHRAEFSQALLQMQHGFSRTLANEKYGQDAVQAAETELMTRLRSGDQAAQFDYQRVMSSSHPYGELMNWHKLQTNLKQIGDDPNVWLQKQLDEKMKDPAFQAKVLELARANAQPSNGSGRPAIQLPPSLNKTPSAMSTLADEDTDQDDAALLKQALRR